MSPNKIPHCIESKVYLKKDQKDKINKWLRVQNWVWNRGLALIEWREWWQRFQTVAASLELGHSPSNAELKKWFADKTEQDLKQKTLTLLDSGLEPVELNWYCNEIEVFKSKSKKGVIKTKKVKEFGLYCDRAIPRKYNPQADIEKEALKAISEDVSLGNRIGLKVGEWLIPQKDKDGKVLWLVYSPGKRIVKEHWVENPILGGTETGRVRNSPIFDLCSQTTAREHADMLDGCPSTFVRGTLKELGNSWAAYKKGLRGKPRYKNRKRRITTLIDPDSKQLKIDNHFVQVPKVGMVKTSKSINQRWNGQPFCPMKITKCASGYYFQATFPVEVKRSKQNATEAAIMIGPNYLCDDSGKVWEYPDFSRRHKKIKQIEKRIEQSKKANSRENGEFCEDWERKNLSKLYGQLSKVYEDIARRKIGWQHFIADRIVQSLSVIILEEINHDKQKINPLLDGGTGQFLINGQSVRRDKNKKLAEIAPGQLQSLIQNKAQERGKTCLKCKLDKRGLTILEDAKHLKSLGRKAMTAMPSEVIEKVKRTTRKGQPLRARG